MYMMTKLVVKSVTCYKDVSEHDRALVVPISKVEGSWIWLGVYTGRRLDSGVEACC